MEANSINLAGAVAPLTVTSSGAVVSAAVAAAVTTMSNGNHHHNPHFPTFGGDPMEAMGKKHVTYKYM